MNDAQEYVLGTDATELKRLKLQHELWRDHLVRLWRKASLRPGMKILELGCGPGFTTLDLDQFLGHQSSITAVDISENFLMHLESLKNPNIHTHKSFIENLELREKNFDAAFCRWLMIFVPDITAAVQRIGAHLNPGGKFAIQEYITFDSFSISPDAPIMQTVVGAIFKSWMDQGGFPNQGRRLPMVLEKNGFRVLEIEPLARVCRPNEPLWQWPETFLYSFVPRLVKTGYLTEAQRTEFFDVWENLKTIEGGFCVTATAVNIIAEKK